MKHDCPSEKCPMCNGEVCDMCGKGSWNNDHELVCEHDVIERHTNAQPSALICEWCGEPVEHGGAWHGEGVCVPRQMEGT